MYSITTIKQFDRDFKLCIKRGLDMDLFYSVYNLLSETGTVPTVYKPHKLKGNYADCKECHIQTDWLLIWKVNEAKKEIYLTRTGTHSDLF